MEGMKSKKDYDYIFKLVLIGDTSVGKSCLLVRFAVTKFLNKQDDQFSENYVTTIGVDFWDTAGQERYRSITNAYYRGAEAIMIVFDLSSKESFEHIPDWIEEVSKFTGPNILKIAVGNKQDLDKSERAVSEQDIAEFESRTGIKVVEVSAKTGFQVDGAFRTVVEKLISNKINRNGTNDTGAGTSKLGDKQKKPNGKCCKS